MREVQRLVSATGLRHVAGGRTILKLDALHMVEGQHLLLLGRSGSGKTTLINVLCGLITPTEGDVCIAGTVMTGLSNAEKDALRRRTIGLVFQTLRLIPAISVRDNLELAQRIALGASDRAAADALIQAVGLGHRADASPRRLSQGEAQRAAIARALVTKPRLVIADEPTSALDDENASAVLNLLFQVAAETGATLLVATHDRRLQDRFVSAVVLDAPEEQAAA